MPRTVFSIKARIRDHSISVPAPENSTRFGIPNACNACHEDKTSAWAAKALQAWGPPGPARQRAVRHAEAFTAARQSDPAAEAALLAIMARADEPPSYGPTRPVTCGGSTVPASRPPSSRR